MSERLPVARTRPKVHPDHLPEAPVLHVFRRGGQRLYYNAFTHKWLLRTSPGSEPSAAEVAELSTVDWLFTPLSMLSVPYLMRVEVTQACNFCCTYCLVFGNDVAQLHEAMSVETARSLLDWYHQTMPGGTVMLIGGEPTMNWPVCELFLDGVPIEASKELHTNGVLLTDARLAWLRDRNVSVRISIDGYERHHQDRRNAAGHTLYPRIIDRFRRALDLGLDVGINCTVTPANLPDLVDINEYFVRELGARKINYSIPHLTTNSGATDGFDMAAYTEAMLEIYETAKDYHVSIAQIMKRLAFLARGRFKAIGCTVLGPETTFYPDGRRTLCTKLDSHPLTRDLRPAEIHQSLPFFQPECRSCAAIGVCGGGCYWDAQMRFDRFQDLRECDFVRRLLERMLWDIVDWSGQPEPLAQQLNTVFGTRIFR